MKPFTFYEGPSKAAGSVLWPWRLVEGAGQPEGGNVPGLLQRVQREGSLRVPHPTDKVTLWRGLLSSLSLGLAVHLPGCPSGREAGLSLF